MSQTDHFLEWTIYSDMFCLVRLLGFLGSLVVLGFFPAHLEVHSPYLKDKVRSYCDGRYVDISGNLSRCCLLFSNCFGWMHVGALALCGLQRPPVTINLRSLVMPNVTSRTRARDYKKLAPTTQGSLNFSLP